jgi:hypothetical protein
VLLRSGDVVDPDYIYTLTNAHLNSLWTAAVAVCDVGVLDPGGAVVVSGSSGFRSTVSRDSSLATYDQYRDTFGFSAIAMPWEVVPFSRLPVGAMFRRDALLLLGQFSAFETADELMAYLHFGAHLIGGTIYVDRALCWSSDQHHSLLAVLPPTTDPGIDEGHWNSMMEQLLGNDITRYLRPEAISRILFGHLPKQRVIALCERHPTLKDILLRAFFDDAAVEPFHMATELEIE